MWKASNPGMIGFTMNKRQEKDTSRKMYRLVHGAACSIRGANYAVGQVVERLYVRCDALPR